MHFCERQQNISRVSCCQFVQLINDTARIPLCNSQVGARAETTTLSPLIHVLNTSSSSKGLFSSSTIVAKKFASVQSASSIYPRLNETKSLISTTRISHSENLLVPSSSTSFSSSFLAVRQMSKGYSTPEYLKVPSEVPEDHVTFLFGIFLLISVAVLCTMFIMRLTKPNKSSFRFAPFPLTIRCGGRNILDYDLMLWLPGINCNSNLRSVNHPCRGNNRHRNNNRHGSSISHSNRARTGVNINPPIIASDDRRKFQRRTSLLVLLRAVASCRSMANDTTEQRFSSISHNSLSTVSTNTTNLNSAALPSYGQAMTPSSSFTLSTSTSRTSSGPPPPPYDELQCLTGNTVTTIHET